MVDYSNYLYALYMASIDGISMSLLKAKHVGMLKGSWMLPLSMLIYSTQPFVFYNALNHESMTIMNILWDISSDILVAAIGFFVFGETLTYTQCLGLLLSFVGITLLGMK